MGGLGGQSVGDWWQGSSFTEVGWEDDCLDVNLGFYLQLVGSIVYWGVW